MLAFQLAKREKKSIFSPTANGINPNIIISRSSKELKKPDADLKWNKLNRLFNLKQFKNVPKLMFDDNGSVLNKMRENGIVALNSLKVNKRLA